MQQDSSKFSSVKAINDVARRHKIVVEYELENESGPAHAKIYTVLLHFGEKQYVGKERSIKSAQRAAAQLALDDNRNLLEREKINKETNLIERPTVALNTWATQHRISTKYILLNEQPLISQMNATWNRPRTLFFYRLYLGEQLYFDGCGQSHQLARGNCAHYALNFIYHSEKSIEMLITPASKQIHQKSPVSIMYERAKKLSLPVHIEPSEPLTITYRIGEQYSSTGTGSTKKAAKILAAEKMLEILPEPIENIKIKPKYNHKRSNQRNKFIEQKGSNSYSSTEEINPITRLYQIARARSITIEFTEMKNLTDEKLFYFHVKFGENDSADGYGKNKQSAKRSAATNLLLKLNSDTTESISNSTSSSLPIAPIKSLLKRDENTNKQQEKKHVHFIEDELAEHEKKTMNHQSSVTIKHQLINACEKLKVNIQYDDQTILNDNQYETILTLSKDDRILAKFRAMAPSLSRAQENVSLTAWKNLQQFFNGSIKIPKTTVKKRYCEVRIPTSIEQLQQQ